MLELYEGIESPASKKILYIKLENLMKFSSDGYSFTNSKARINEGKFNHITLSQLLFGKNYIDEWSANRYTIKRYLEGI